MREPKLDTHTHNNMYIYTSHTQAKAHTNIAKTLINMHIEAHRGTLAHVLTITCSHEHIGTHTSTHRLMCTGTHTDT